MQPTQIENGFIESLKVLATRGPVSLRILSECKGFSLDYSEPPEIDPSNGAVANPILFPAFPPTRDPQKLRDLVSALSTTKKTRIIADNFEDFVGKVIEAAKNSVES